MGQICTQSVQLLVGHKLCILAHKEYSFWLDLKEQNWHTKGIATGLTEMVHIGTQSVQILASSKAIGWS